MRAHWCALVRISLTTCRTTTTITTTTTTMLVKSIAHAVGIDVQVDSICATTTQKQQERIGACLCTCIRACTCARASECVCKCSHIRPCGRWDARRRRRRCTCRLRRTHMQMHAQTHAKTHAWPQEFMLVHIQPIVTIQS